MDLPPFFASIPSSGGRGPLSALRSLLIAQLVHSARIKYHGPLKLYGGYEWIQFAPPSNPQTAFTDIAGNALCLGCAAINNTNIINTAFDAHDKILQVFWTGAKYAVTDKLDVIGGYYHYNQNNFGAGAPCNTAAKATCSGTFDAVSFAVEWRFAAKFEAYAGFMFS